MHGPPDQAHPPGRVTCQALDPKRCAGRLPVCHRRLLLYHGRIQHSLGTGDIFGARGTEPIRLTSITTNEGMHSLPCPALKTNHPRFLSTHPVTDDILGARGAEPIRLTSITANEGMHFPSSRPPTAITLDCFTRTPLPTTFSVPGVQSLSASSPSLRMRECTSRPGRPPTAITFDCFTPAPLPATSSVPGVQSPSASSPPLRMRECTPPSSRPECKALSSDYLPSTVCPLATSGVQF